MKIMAKINVWKIVRRVLRFVLLIAKEKSEDSTSSEKKKTKNS